MFDLCRTDTREESVPENNNGDGRRLWSHGLTCETDIDRDLQTTKGVSGTQWKMASACTGSILVLEIQFFEPADSVEESSQC